MSDDRAEWLEWRRKHIGASDVPRILLGLYGGPHKVWREKLGLEPPSEETEGQALGHLFEEPLILVGVDRLGWGKPLRVQTQARFERGFLAATLDAVCWYDDGPRILEIKTTGHSIKEPLLDAAFLDVRPGFLGSPQKQIVQLMHRDDLDAGEPSVPRLPNHVP